MSALSSIPDCMWFCRSTDTVFSIYIGSNLGKLRAANGDWRGLSTAIPVVATYSIPFPKICEAKEHVSRFRIVTLAQSFARRERQNAVVIQF